MITINSKSIKLVLIMLICTQIKAQKEIEANQMILRYEIIGDSIYGFISAPTTGWILIGFNDQNTVNKADLKFFSVVNGKAMVSDHKNLGFRDYPADSTLGGANEIRIIYHSERENQTGFLFALPLRTDDSNDFQHTVDQSFWLILAYSEEDDFKHHSMMRKHLPFIWEPSYKSIN